MTPRDLATDNVSDDHSVPLTLQILRKTDNHHHTTRSQNLEDHDVSVQSSKIWNLIWPTYCLLQFFFLLYDAAPARRSCRLVQACPLLQAYVAAKHSENPTFISNCRKCKYQQSCETFRVPCEPSSHGMNRDANPTPKAHAKSLSGNLTCFHWERNAANRPLRARSTALVACGQTFCRLDGAFTPIRACNNCTDRVA